MITEVLNATAVPRRHPGRSSTEALDETETGDADLIDAYEVARITGMSVPWIRKETRAGRIPHVPLGRRVWYRRKSIGRWLQEIERGG